MTHGKLLFINIDMVTPNMICMDQGADWPATDIWNYEKFLDDNVNAGLVREGEDFDHMGTKGFYR